MKTVLESRDDIELAGCFDSAENLHHALAIVSPDLVLMDVEMPGINGIEALKKLRGDFPELPVIMLTIHDQDQVILDSIQAGSNGFLLKVSSEEEIVQAIRSVHDGKGSLSPEVTEKVFRLLAERFQKSALPEYDLLSSREKEVIQRMIDGKSHKVIADELCISYDTVRAHIKSIYKKLNQSSVAGVVSKAVRSNRFR